MPSERNKQRLKSQKKTTNTNRIHMEERDVALLMAKRRQYLVCRYCKEVRGVSIVSLSRFHEIINDMVRLQNKHIAMAEILPFEHLCMDIVRNIKENEYPQEIVSMAKNIIQKVLTSGRK